MNNWLANKWKLYFLMTSLESKADTADLVLDRFRFCTVEFSFLQGPHLFFWAPTLIIRVRWGCKKPCDKCTVYLFMSDFSISLNSNRWSYSKSCCIDFSAEKYDD